MRPIVFVEELGFARDLVMFFISNFNRDRLLEFYESYAELRSRCPEIPEELRIFFHADEYRKSLVGQWFDLKKQKTLVFDKFGLDALAEIAEDSEYAKRRVLRHYFPELGDAELRECMDSVAAAGRLIRESAYGDNIKSGLYAFMIEPKAVLQLLAELLAAGAAALREEYARRADELKALQAGFDFAWVIESAIPEEYAKIVLAEETAVFVTFMLHENVEFCWRREGGGASLALGCDYREILGARKHRVTAPDLQEFGQAISDHNRVAILRLARERERITVHDVELATGLSGTNVYYHLMQLQKAGMLERGSYGKTAYFSLDPDYFRGLCRELEEFAEPIAHK